MTRPHVFLTPLIAAVAALVAVSGCNSTGTTTGTTATSATRGPENAAAESTQQFPISQAPPAEQTSRYPDPTPVSQTNQPTTTTPGQPNITAKAAILIDKRGRILYEKNANTRLPVASTQKLLLGILIAENGNLSRQITVQDVDTWAEPTVMRIKPGQVYTREELLRAVLIRSSNDISRALARDHSGSVSAFAAAMNRKARSLGMNDSYFTNASGLPSPPGQYSTARDLAILGSVALRQPFVRDAIRTKGMVFRFSDGTTKTIYNTNQVLRSFPYCTGAKTGFTNAAGRCLVSSASYNGREVIAVILGSKIPNVWTESEALLRYGLGM